MLLGGESFEDQGPEAPGQTRTLLLSVCPTYHGCLALEQVLMSSRGLATLCPARTWLCEGDALLCPANPLSLLSRANMIEDLNDEGTRGNTGPDWDSAESEDDCEFHTALDDDDEDVPWPAKQAWHEQPTWNESRALNEWTHFWNLSKPVLLEKSPNLWRHVRSVVAGVQATIPLPLRMRKVGIGALTLQVVLLWRPWCLAPLSSHASQAMQHDGVGQFLEREHEVLKKLAARHRDLSETLGAERVLAVSFADLLWSPDATLSRMQAFLPALGALDLAYEARLHVDVFPANAWPTNGPLADFASAHPPSALGYDAEARACVDEPKRDFGTQGRAEAFAAHEYLRRVSDPSGASTADFNE